MGWSSLDSKEFPTNFRADKHESKTRQRDHRVLTSRSLHVLTQKLDVSRKQNEEAEPEKSRVKVH
jgi:hypothetical protein